MDGEVTRRSTVRNKERERVPTDWMFRTEQGMWAECEGVGARG
jgi:hypothetical protein